MGGALQTALNSYAACPVHEDTERGIYAIYPHKNDVSPKFRAFVDFMVDYIGEPPYWSRS